uniref:Putative secreted peptide 30 n=1 Tax=Lonomia obliqua TaxID=304329 RepID=Q5MGF7_LONON|nr:putative secreted peptide 30 [Lonomia obliqua]
MVSKIFIISLVICMANAATWMGMLPKKPKQLAHKEGCYVEEINDVVPFGTELKPIGYCYRIF